jgi:exosortase/archaeosortase family protein
MFLLIAAVLPYPAGWRAKLAGVIGGVGLMYLLNQVRILVLVLSLHWHRDWFASLHGFIAPTCIVVIGGIYFLVWTNTVEDRVQT